MKPGRNDPCHCGSGKKYKKCCSAKDDAARSAELLTGGAARTAALASEKPAQQEKASKGASATPNAVAPRTKGPPPKSPTQLRRRSV